jgi:hypothetical protein
MPGLPTDEATEDDSPHEPIRLTIPPRYITLVGGACTVGVCLGVMRGSRKASLQFLAENAHRAPRTVRGWYLYNKTKNYKVMLGAIRAGSWEASRLGVTMLGWVLIEEVLERAGCGDIKEIGAGIGTASVFSIVCELIFLNFLGFWGDCARELTGRVQRDYL